MSSPGPAPVPSSPLLPLPGLPGSGPVPAPASTPPPPGPAPTVPAVVVPPPVPPLVSAPVAPGLTPVSTFAQSQHNADGTFTQTLSPSPLFRKTASGLMAIDATVKASADPALPAAADAALRPIRFGTTSSEVAQLALDAGPVTLSAPGLNIGAPQINPDGVSYPAVATDTDLRYRVTAGGLKEEVVLASPSAPTSFTFHLADPKAALGAAKALPGGGYSFANKIDDAAVSLPAPFAYEQRSAGAGVIPRDLTSAHLGLTKAGDGWDLVVSVDPTWLASTGRTFPIVIDPTVNFSDANAFDGSYEYSPSLHPTCPGCGGVNGSDPNDGTGTYNDATFDFQPSRTAMSFNLSSIPTGSAVSAANLNLYQDGCLGVGANYYCNSHSYPVELHAYTAAWSTGTATWDSLAAITAAGSFGGYTQAPFPGGTRQWTPAIDMTGQVQSWVNGTTNNGTTNNGFALMLPPQPANWGGPLYASADNTTYPHPYLSVTYTVPAPPGAPTAVYTVAGNTTATVHWAPPAANGTPAIDLYAVNAYYPDGSYTGIQALACANCTSVVVPGLTNGRAYYFAVFAHNGGGYGPGTISGFVTPAVAPGAPTSAQGSVSTGWYHSLVARPDGTVAAFGLNNVGQLGNNTTVDAHSPIVVPGLSGVTQVAAGYAHSLALKSDGTVWAWGYNNYGQLGNNTIVDSHVPIAVPGLTAVVAISTSFSHNLALKSDGTVWAWGWNGNGELGNNTIVDSHVPIAVPGLANMVAVAAGYAHSLTLRSDGSVWSFGLNNLGQLGNNTTVDAHAPIQVAYIMSAVAISAGLAHSVALRGDGIVLDWGYNGYGQLGNNTTVDSHVKIDVAALSGVTAISADGGYDTMARTADGTLWAWGYNGYGQLGNNSTVDAHLPVAVAGLAAVTQASAGIYHSLAVKADGSLAAFGYNGYGQLGTNTIVDAHSAVTPTGPGLAAQSATLAATAGTRAVSVSWAAPAATGGDPITSYAVTLYRGTPGAGVLTASQSCAGPCTTATFASLADNTSYYVTVAAVTAAGTGPVATSNPTTTAGDTSGAGDRPFFTYHTTAVDDRVTAKVNVGTGNLDITSPDLSVPVVGGTRALAHVYNSLALAPAATGQTSPVFGNGWRFSDAPDRRLIINADNTVTFMSGSGNAATFTAGTYTAPAGLDATLAHNGDGTWTMGYHQTAEKLTFRSDGLLTADADRNANTITITYPGGGGYETSITGTAGTTPGNTVNLIYAGPGGRLSSMTQTADGVTRTVGYSYDGANNLYQVTDAAGRVTTFNYDTANNLTQITGPAPLNAVTMFGYDAGHRVTTVTQIIATGNAVTTFDYSAAGHTKITDADGHPPTNYSVDSSGRITAAVDAKGQSTSTTYIADAKVGTTVNGYGAATGTTTNLYGANAGESLTQSTGPTQAVVKFSYATPGLPYLPDSTTDAMGRVSTYGYDGPGNLKSNADSANNKAQVSFNADGTVHSSTDPANGTNATTYGYNTAHQLTTVTPPTGNSLAARGFSYDGSGRPKTVTDGKGVTTTYSYDALHRPTGETHSDATAAIGYSYDANGNLYQRTDGSGTTTFGHDAANRLTTKAIPGGPTLTYSYDPAGNLTAMGGDGRGSTGYHYDKLNLVDQVTESSGRTDIFGYDANHQRIDTWYATNTTVAYDATGNTVIAPTGYAGHIHATIDGAGHLTRLKTTRASSDTDANRLSDLSYTYTVPAGTACPGETAGQFTDIRHTSTDNLTTKVTAYCYDGSGRLTSATTTSGGPIYNYGYDADGNRTTDPLPGGLGLTASHTFNSANQLTDPLPPAGPATYDANGNLTASGAYSNLTYNGIDQTTSATATGQAALALSYAGAGQAERTGAGTITYLNGLLGVQAETTAGATTYYEKDPAGSLLAERVGTTEYYYYFDGTGSVIGLIGPAGAQRATYTYDPYGSTATATAVNGNLPANPWRYAGGYLDNTTGLYHNGARYYDPTLGRFSQQDTIIALDNPANGNRYAYSGDDPINGGDPSGRFTVDFSIQGCFGICLSGGVTFDTNGGLPSPHVGVGIGPEAELSVSQLQVRERLTLDHPERHRVLLVPYRLAEV